MSDSVQRAVKAHLERHIASGGSKVTILLGAKETEILKEICDLTGLSRTVVINKLIVSRKI
jgi:hypothetical protein